MKRLEVDHYPEIAEALKQFFSSSFSDPEKFSIKSLIGEISSSLRTLIANGYDAGDALRFYSNDVHRLHLDISILVENTETGEFEIIIFEIKKTKTMGLKELSQLIGYCLVSKAEFGILMNVDNSVSRELSVILDGDKDLTLIQRVIGDKTYEHRFGVMVWNSKTHKIEYTESGSIKTMSELIEMLEKRLL